MWASLVKCFSWMGFAWARRRLDAETQRELEAHIELLVGRYVASGLTPEEAAAAARRQLGNVTLVREKIHELNGIRWLDGLMQDLRYACRQLRQSPGFAAVVIVTLGLGIGGTTAIFSVVRSTLLAPLPYEESGQLLRFYQQDPDKPETPNYLAGTHFTFLRDHATSFENVAALANYRETGLDLVSNGQAQRLRVLRVTSDYFTTLRSSPSRGQGFDRDDERGTRRVVLSDRLWRTRFVGDASMIGTSIRLNGEPYQVIGIAPQDFDDPIAGEVDAWVPYNLSRDTNEENTSLTAVGRLRNGVNLERAQAELAVLSRALKARWPASRHSAVIAVPLQEDLVAAARGPLHLLFAAVGLVLLVACANVANLALVRMTGRVHEFAMRSALGSGRGRLARQLLVESFLLAGLGGLLGLVMAGIGADVLRGFGDEALPRLDEAGFDLVVLGFAALTTTATAIAFSIAPALRLIRLSPNQALRQQSRSATGTQRQAWIRSGLATAQLALAMTLLVGASVLVASFHRLQQVNLGFRVERVLTFEVNLPTSRYNAERRAVFQEELAHTIQTIPGVIAAGGISRLPATGTYHPWNTLIRSGPRAGGSVRRVDGFNIQQRTVSGDVFSALEIPVLAGRTFDTRDNASAPSRAVVSVNFARQAFPGLPYDGSVGQRIAAGGRELEIIGVVGDVTLDVYGAPALVVYHAHAQFADDRNWSLMQVVAAELPAERLLASVRAKIAALDPELVVYQAAPMTEVTGRGSSRERFALILMGSFAGVSLLLASLGLYGVLAYAVRQRTQEIGIRMALGATGAQVRALVLRQATLVLGIGLLVGTSGALAFGRWLRALAFEISPSDPRILLAAGVLLTMTGFVAAWLPARRASRIAPRIAMQEGN